MLLDELLAERERGPVPATPPPVLTVDPIAVPQTIETGRRAIRQRLVELESAARRNYRSAEEARRVLADEHQRLEQELNARTHAQHEAAALRREVERLSTEETRRAAQERARAEREARAQIAGELKRFQEEHERVVQELTSLRGSLSEHDGLLDEYVIRLREEQGARAALRAELERAEAARSLAERSLQRATENARHGAEDEMIRLATAEQRLADALSDRERLSSRLAELTSGEGVVGRMTAQLAEKDGEIGRLEVRIADLGARIDASEDAARQASAARDDAEARRLDAEQARAEAESAVEVAAARIGELEAELAELAETTDVRAREIDKTLGKLRREARDASNARRTAEGNLAAAEAERDEFRARAAELEAECSRARADGDSLRAHAAMLGDELAAARATVAELRAAVPSSPAPRIVPVPVDDRAYVVEPVFIEPLAVEPAAPVDVPAAVRPDDAVVSEPPPLPLRIAGRHAPAAPPLARRRARHETAPAATAPVTAPATAVEGPAEIEPEPARAEVEAAAEPAVPALPPDTNRRTALAAFTALATSSGDDFSPRRR